MECDSVLHEPPFKDTISDGESTGTADATYAAQVASVSHRKAYTNVRTQKGKSIASHGGKCSHEVTDEEYSQYKQQRYPGKYQSYFLFLLSLFCKRDILWPSDLQVPQGLCEDTIPAPLKRKHANYKFQRMQKFHIAFDGPNGAPQFYMWKKIRKPRWDIGEADTQLHLILPEYEGKKLVVKAARQSLGGINVICETVHSMPNVHVPKAKKVAKEIRTANVVQQGFAKSSFKVPVNPVITQYPLERIYVDLTAIYRKGQTVIWALNMVDHFTGYSKIASVSSKEMGIVVPQIAAFIDELSAKVAPWHKIPILPLFIHCDNGTEFKNVELLDVCDRKGCIRICGAIYQPKQQGKVEQLNLVTKTVLSQLLDILKLSVTQWSTCIDELNYITNNRVIPRLRLSKEALVSGLFHMKGAFDTVMTKTLSGQQLQLARLQKYEMLAKQGSKMESLLWQKTVLPKLKIGSKVRVRPQDAFRSTGRKKHYNEVGIASTYPFVAEVLSISKNKGIVDLKWLMKNGGWANAKCGEVKRNVPIDYVVPCADTNEVDVHILQAMQEVFPVTTFQKEPSVNDDEVLQRDAASSLAKMKTRHELHQENSAAVQAKKKAKGKGRASPQTKAPCKTPVSAGSVSQKDKWRQTSIICTKVQSQPSQSSSQTQTVFQYAFISDDADIQSQTPSMNDDTVNVSQNDDNESQQQLEVSAGQLPKSMYIASNIHNSCWVDTLLFMFFVFSNQARLSYAKPYTPRTFNAIRLFVQLLSSFTRRCSSTSTKEIDAACKPMFHSKLHNVRDHVRMELMHQNVKSNIMPVDKNYMTAQCSLVEVLSLVIEPQMYEEHCNAVANEDIARLDDYMNFKFSWHMEFKCSHCGGHKEETQAGLLYGALSNGARRSDIVCCPNVVCDIPQNFKHNASINGTGTSITVQDFFDVWYDYYSGQCESVYWTATFARKMDCLLQPMKCCEKAFAGFENPLQAMMIEVNAPQILFLASDMKNLEIEGDKLVAFGELYELVHVGIHANRSHYISYGKLKSHSVEDEEVNAEWFFYDDVDGFAQQCTQPFDTIVAQLKQRYWRTCTAMYKRCNTADT